MALIPCVLFHRTVAGSFDISWRSGSYSPMCLPLGEACGHVPTRGLSWHCKEAVKYGTMKDRNQAHGRLSIQSMYCELGEVTPVLMSSTMISGGLRVWLVRSRDINTRKEKGRGSLIWMVCRRIKHVIWVLCWRILSTIELNVAIISGVFC